MSALVPTVSVVIPTYNEETNVGELLDSLCSMGADEILVVDGGSTDATLAAAQGRARVLSSALGRAVQMNRGARDSRGDVLLFLHADVRFRNGSSALSAIRGAMRDPGVLGGNLDIRYEGADWTARAFTWINRHRRRWGVFYGDSGIFCRRDVFERFGGYRPWPILEDYEFARRLWKAGRLALLDEPIWVSDRRWRRAGVWATMWRWFWIQALYLGGVSPHRLAGMYRDVR